NDLILVFLGLEILSIALYVLAGYHQRQERSREAAIKYFVLGSFSSAFFLYGVALTYGATGSTNLGAIAAFLRTQTVTSGVLLGGMAFLLVGLGFKVAAVPFHMWTPDVYEGSPTPVTGFMAAAAKAAGFAALLRIFFSAFGTGYSIFTLAVTGAALVATWALWDEVGAEGGQPRLAVSDAVVIDGFSVFFTLVVCSAVFLAVLLSDSYLEREQLFRPDYFVLMLLSASGGILMAKANDLILVFLGLEILSIALYVLAGYHIRRTEGLEASIKYFVLGAFSSAFFLYGVALTYGATGSTNLGTIATFLRTQTVTSGVFLGGMAFLLVGLGFKVAAVPFHMWTPDVYQGSPTPVTGFMAAAAKAAGFAALLRIFFSTFGDNRLDWQPIVWVLAVLSLLVGSVLAVVQTDVKRMLAYSSIAHAGYVLIGLQAANERGIAGSLFYLLAYTFMIIGSFGVVTLVGRRGDNKHSLDDYRGLAQNRPGLAFVFTVFLLAQAGVPLTSGFLAKFYVISAAVEARSYAIAIIAMLAAVIATFFYLRVIVVMYMDAGSEASDEAAETEPTEPDEPAEPDEPRVTIPLGAGIALGLTLAFTLVVGFLPEPVLDFARHATLFRL
ncbi:MAG: NADH-quinone oxidoreductase subunit N, partial [Acidimicrobiales bacterium]